MMHPIRRARAPRGGVEARLLLDGAADGVYHDVDVGELGSERSAGVVDDLIGSEVARDLQTGSGGGGDDVRVERAG